VINPRLNELDLVVLKHDLPEHGLVAGDVGTVVLIHRAGEAFEVEFVAGGGTTLAVETLRWDQVAALSEHQVLHARTLAATG
jgi:hypothetical protein